MAEGNDIIRSLGRGGGRGRGRGHQNLDEVPWKRLMGYRKLEELQDKDANAIVMTFDKYKAAFRTCVEQTTLQKERRHYMLLLRCVAKCSECESLRQLVIEMFTVIETSSFIDDFEEIVIGMVDNASPRKQEEYQRQLRDILKILQRMKAMLPKARIKIRGLLSGIDTCINVLKSDTTILDDEMWEMYENLSRTGTERRTAVRDNYRRENQDDDEEEPDGNFRDFPLFPTIEEVQSANPPTLRRNKVFGGYRNLEHYLDVQYRLLREDFIAPLRDGIKDYIEAVNSHGHTMNKKLNELRIYRDVQIISPICNNHGLCRRVCFTYPGMNKIRWEQSKHLIYGSLVCLSADNFQTVWFATVANRDLKIVRKGLIDLKFEKDYEEISQISPDTVFVMAETTAYFEAYKHVLVGLQNTQDGDFPFEDYIVKCLHDVKEPNYLRRIPDMKYDLRPLVDEDIQLDDRKVDTDDTYKFSEKSEEARAVDVQDQAAWPTPELLHLDISQLRALEAALSKEFSVIQGPPGTGKTYIGLKIIRALLHNRNIWSINPDTGAEENRPILVVCYTNHALDQFLEGIVSCYSGNVLRLGSRSSSDILKRLSIYNKRMTMRENREVPLEIHSSRRDVKHNINSLQLDVNKIADRIEKAKREILHEDALKHVMGEFYDRLKSEYEAIMLNVYREEIKRETLVKQSAILEWLGFGEYLGFETAFEDKPKPKPDQQEEQEGDDDDNRDENREEAERRPQDFVSVLDENDVEIAHRRAAADDSDSDDDSIEDRLEKLLRENIPLVALDVSELDLFLRQPKQEGMRWQIPKKKNKALKKKIRQKLSSTDRMTEEEVESCPYDLSLWNDMGPDERWRLYRYWLKVYCDDLQEIIRDKEIEYENVCTKYMKS